MSWRALARYAFVPFLVLVVYLQGELGTEAVYDTQVMLGLAASIALYAATPKTLFRALYFNYLVIWFCVGTVNFMVHRLVWIGWDGDILAYNRLCALFLVVYSAAAYAFGRDIRAEPPGPIAKVAIDLRFSAQACAVMIVLFAALALPAVGWTGVYGGGITDDNRFNLELSGLLPRLSLAFPLLGCILAHQLARREVSIARVLLFLGVTFFLMSVMGARFGFFQVLVTCFLFLVFSGQGKLIWDHRVLASALVVFLLAVQLLLGALRSGSEVTEDLDVASSSAIVLASFGGEHRDAAASLVLISQAERRQVADSYLPSLIYPLFPGPMLSAVGIDKKAALEVGGAYAMQQAYGVENGTIRIGGIAEAYFWLGWIGVAIAAVVNAFAACAIDRVAHSRRPAKTFASVAFAAYGAVWVLYFVVSQSNMLLGGFAAFVVLYYVLALVARNDRNSPTT